MHLVIRIIGRCPRCSIELLEQDRWSEYCPRCAANFKFEEFMQEGGLVDEAKRKSWQAAIDLGKVFENWGIGYVRILDESGKADYSLLDEFSFEVQQQAFWHYLKQWPMAPMWPVSSRCWQNPFRRTAQ